MVVFAFLDEFSWESMSGKTKLVSWDVRKVGRLVSVSGRNLYIYIYI